MKTKLLTPLLPLILALGFLSTDLHAQGTPAPITAIDILLEPDAAMLKHAEANNARLLKA
jgi:hypothetical protein